MYFLKALRDSVFMQKPTRLRLECSTVSTSTVVACYRADDFGRDANHGMLPYYALSVHWDVEPRDFCMLCNVAHCHARRSIKQPVWWT